MTQYLLGDKFKVSNDDIPIFFDDEGHWYFYDETFTWSKAKGPFNTREEAVKACFKYAEDLSGS